MQYEQLCHSAHIPTAARAVLHIVSDEELCAHRLDLFAHRRAHVEGADHAAAALGGADRGQTCGRVGGGVGVVWVWSGRNGKGGERHGKNGGEWE